MIPKRMPSIATDPDPPAWCRCRSRPTAGEVGLQPCELVTGQGTCHLARRRPPGELPGPHIPGVDRHRGGGGQDGRTGTRPHDPRLGEGSTDCLLYTSDAADEEDSVD